MAALHPQIVQTTVTPEPAVEDLAGDLRALMARRQLYFYDLAHYLRLHPATIGQLLRGRKRLRPELAERIRQAIDAATRDREAV